MSTSVIALEPMGKISAIAANVDNRLVVRCDFCNMVQYETKSGKCRRPECNRLIVFPKLPPPTVELSSNFQISAQKSLDFLGGRIHALRKHRGLTLLQMAEIVDSSRCYLSRIENGQAYPGISTLEKIIYGLKYPADVYFYHPDSLEWALWDTYLGEVASMVRSISRSQKHQIISTIQRLCEANKKGTQ